MFIYIVRIQIVDHDLYIVRYTKIFFNRYLLWEFRIQVIMVLLQVKNRMRWNLHELKM